MQAFSTYQWPGNVRELRNAVEAFLAIGVLPDTSGAPQELALDAALADFVKPRQPYADQKDELVRRFHAYGESHFF